ncbi:uncharacterized protein LOC116778156 [Danaus plexippus]|uniref:Uncharacterized protein n=1 Tax=Danaus plexippus plexippus TaxID=278856 RepID=A0A212FHJ3_DANPL|nr:uncharacterized protein LOC116778156 [Danaus plexippus]OWR53195.1 hypothetical protein KGM_201390 [Danaus plexippus plexippus]
MSWQPFVSICGAKKSLKSGAGEDDVYKPVWLYYDAIETFLAPVYKCHVTINTEEGLISPVLPNVDDETHNDNELINDQHDEQNSEKQKPANNKKLLNHLSKESKPVKIVK